MEKNATGDSRQTLRSNTQHEPWCDPKEHATAVRDGMGDSGCVGRYH